MPTRRLAPDLRPRHELDSMVANVELTLISIVQGVALAVLADSARSVIMDHRLSSLPYLVSGLLILFMAWSRTVLHALTVIRWPLELGHNFLYIAATLLEVVLFSQLSNVRAWYPLGGAYMTLVWITFAYDLRLIRARFGDSGGPEGQRLLAILEGDQLLHVRVLLPFAVACWLACSAAVLYWPSLFLGAGWHAALAVGQASAFGAYLLFTVDFFRGVSHLVVSARKEWDAPAGAPGGEDVTAR